uniref:RNA-binding protein 4.1-like n=1 Tax=Styela clava TaxID=7725 RepID=UPI00193A861E|nr:RNA-binding protein 4.1-like [Styela clava]
MVKIFVGNIPSDCARADVLDIFEKYGKVRSCDIIRNFAFVHMDNEDDARDAIEALNNSRFMGGEITVEESKSRPRNTQKLYVGNLSSTANRRELEKLFEKYGEVVSCDIIKDYAFVHMMKEREAEKAIKELSGVNYAGRKIVVDYSRNNDNNRRFDNRYGNDGRYGRDYGNDRYGGYGGGGYRGRGGGFGGGYRRGGGYYNNYNNYNQGGGYGGGRYNSYNRDRSPIRRRRDSRSRSRSMSKSRSPQHRDDRYHTRSRSMSNSPDRGNSAAKKSASRSPKSASPQHSDARDRNRSVSRSRSKSRTPVQDSPGRRGSGSRSRSRSPSGSPQHRGTRSVTPDGKSRSSESE